jgi:predicted PurR-regulated permease PerM
MPEDRITPLDVTRDDNAAIARANTPLQQSSVLQSLAVGVVIVASLHFARDVFIPIALAVLLSFALGPLVSALRRARVGRVPSVFISVLIAAGIFLVLGSMIASQLTQLAADLPQYQKNIGSKIRDVRGSFSPKSVVGRASDMLKDLSDEIAPTPTPPSTSPSLTEGTNTPVPVEVHTPSPSALQLLQNVLRPVIKPLVTTGIVIVFVIFFLLQREDLRDRFIRLLGSGDIHRTTRGLDDAAHRLSRYLLTQGTVNAGFGLLIGIGLWVIGIPNPVLWAILAMLLRFVPYVGVIMAALAPITLALAIDPGWSLVAWTATLFIVIDLIVGQALEPVLFGRSTGLSPVAVVVSATFWTWLWGPVGLLLSTPLTLCLVVIGRHVQRLTFLDIVLGDAPALSPPENFYQRILAGAADEAAMVAETYLKEKTLTEYYDDVAIAGLTLAQRDMNRGLLDHERRVKIKESIYEVIDNLAEHADGQKPQPPAETGIAPAATSAPLALCIAGRGSLDESAAALLAQLLSGLRFEARVVANETVTAAAIHQFDALPKHNGQPRIVFLSYLEAGGLSSARYLVRRLRRKLPGAYVIACFWMLKEDDQRYKDAVAGTGADAVATSLSTAIELATKIAVDPQLSAQHA